MSNIYTTMENGIWLTASSLHELLMVVMERVFLRACVQRIGSSILCEHMYCAHCTRMFTRAMWASVIHTSADTHAHILCTCVHPCEMHIHDE